VDIALPAEMRPAHADEVDAAVRLLVCSASGSIDENQHREFIRLAKSQKPETAGLWVGTQEDRILTAALSLVSPGRTVLLFLPVHLFSEYQSTLTCQLIRTICQNAKERDIHLIQCLLDVHDVQISPVLQTCSFERLAELLYLQRSVGKNVNEPSVPDSYRWITYGLETHSLFAQTILATYQQSLDCPRLNGLRNIEDILAGHRGTGIFDPSLWYILLDANRPVGVVLLSYLDDPDLLELVYLGLVPGFRGAGIGDILMRRAAAVAAQRGGKLSLAVDAGNLPALKLYWRHGLHVIGRKQAFFTDLRRNNGLARELK
jgi:mycothiol synthase